MRSNDGEKKRERQRATAVVAATTTTTTTKEDYQMSVMSYLLQAKIVDELDG